MRRLLSGRRWLVALITMLVAGVSIGMVGSPRAHTRALCADLPDSVGLYQDAPVTIMGMKIGSVTGLDPSGDHVRVAMTIDDRALSHDVGAVVMNNSILTDRRVELIDWRPVAGRTFDFASCIPRSRTATPININDSLEVFKSMADQVAAIGKDNTAPVGDLITRLSTELDAAGPTLNHSLVSLDTLLDAPDDFMSQLRQILGNADELSTTLAGEWQQVKTFAPTLTTVFGVAAQLLGLYPGLLQNMTLASAKPLQRIFTEHLPYLNPLLEKAVPITELMAENAESGKDVMAKVPAIVQMFADLFDKQRSAVEVKLSPPRYDVAATSPAQVCAVLNHNRPGSCTVTGNSRAAVPLVQMVLSAVGGQA